MRDRDRWRMGLLALAVIVLAACSDDDEIHPCAEGGCICEDDNECVIDCPADECATECDSVDTCDVSCGDFCDYACVSSSDCLLVCDDACAATCDSVSTCEVDCGEDCDVLCTALSACRVTMLSGVVTCEGVSECAVDCVVPGGTEPAEDCGDGVFACGDCP